MNSGKLRHRIEIQSSVENRSGSGAVKDQTWVPFCYVWASIEPLSGREYFAAAQAQSTVSHKITMRYRADIVPYYRIIWKSRIFQILTILDIREEHRELTLYCTEVVAPPSV